uniref:3-oxoadipyl-CoA thiolase n=1 Tax=Solibacter usitatus (strain Ellin6076) TaxID=234267 RepID=Q02CF3_SOLUE
MRQAFLCDAVRTPFGRYGGALAGVRTDDLAAIPLRALLGRNPQLDPGALDDVVYGCVNQAGEDNRNVARMALLLAGIPESVPGTTVNRLCGSSLEAAAVAARAIRCGEIALAIAGGVESMSRSPLVLSKPDAAWTRSQKIEDSTLGWRFVNPLMKERYGVDSMAETAENVATECGILRADQDAFAFRSQQRAGAAMTASRLAEEIVAVEISKKPAVSTDEHPRPDTTLEALTALRPIVRPGGTVTAGNASGINDGAGALLLAGESAAAQYGLTPKARIVATAVAGVAPRAMGLGPVPAVRKVLALTGLTLGQIDLIELNEAFAAQALAVLRALGLADDAAHVNPDGGAIALGHPLGASGARLLGAAVRQLQCGGGRYALCTMCIGVGQGIATIVERV